MGDFINPYLAGTKNWANSVQIATPTVIAWQKTIATEIEKAELELPKKHLIGQNVGNFQMSVRTEDLVPQASVINFHYAYPEAVDWNRGLDRVIGYDETGFAGSADKTYRRQAWNFVLSGGALFNNLDYSFSVGHEQGDDLDNEAPGGGSPTLRRQLHILATFLDQFRLEGLRPERGVVTRASGVSFRCLGEPGRQYAIYLQGRSPAQLDLALPRGKYKVAWTDIITGGSLGEGPLESDGEGTSVVSPVFQDGVALSIHRTDPQGP